MRILTVNAGSTSLKLSVLDGDRTIQTPSSLDETLANDPPDVVAHRVVHGGDRTAAARVDDDLLAELHRLSDLAPLHQPPALAAIEQIRARWPHVPNVACFDTAFHHTIPAAARTYALPAEVRATVRVFGFHGLSHAWSAGRIAALAPDARRVIIAHLGGGQSLCAVRDGRSVMTSMGFTPLDGLVMATRCGALDPGAVLWMQRHLDDDVDDLLERRSGLVGLCGDGDMAVVRRRAAGGDELAAAALDVWRHRLITGIGGCVAALGGLDALVFTAGIGEHDAPSRAEVAAGMAWAGVRIDDDGTATHTERELTASGAAVRTFVVAAREDRQLAAETTALLA